MLIPRRLSLLTLLVLVLLSSGCTRRNVNMTPTGQAAATLQPSPGKALVVFLRPGRAAGLVHASVYDNDAIIGISSANTAIPYQAQPGPHRFMVVSEAADFLDADLTEGRTYYVQVGYRTGLWRVRFSLIPLDPQRQRQQIDAWVRSVQVVSLNDEARHWDQQNRASVMEKRADYLRKWESRSPEDRATLHAIDGVDLGVQTIEAPANSAPRGGPAEGTPRTGDTADRLRELERLKREGLVSDSEYKEQRRRLLNEL